MDFFLITSHCLVLGHGPGPKPKLVPVLGPGPSPIIFLVPASVPVPFPSYFWSWPWSRSRSRSKVLVPSHSAHPPSTQLSDFSKLVSYAYSLATFYSTKLTVKVLERAYAGCTKLSVKSKLFKLFKSIRR